MIESLDEQVYQTLIREYENITIPYYAFITFENSKSIKKKL